MIEKFDQFINEGLKQGFVIVVVGENESIEPKVFGTYNSQEEAESVMNRYIDAEMADPQFIRVLPIQNY